MANEPVMIVMDGRFLFHAGDPTTIGKKLISEYAQKGYKIQTITIEQYRSREWKWHWERKTKRKNLSRTNEK